MANELATLQIRRRSEKPMAMGRTPPDFLSNAIKRLPKKTRATSPEQRPARVMLTNPVSAARRSGPPTLQSSITFRWRGLKPSGPPVDPAGKDKIALLISSSEVTKGEAPSGTQMGTGCDPMEEGGCFC